jgi:thymidylate synthase (FAD)
MTNIHDGGFAILDAAMADDLSVVNAARVSFSKHSESMGDAEAGLIGFLMRERHGTPFEHNAFRFHVRCPIFVAREWFRHRIGSFNELSARYTELPENAYLPDGEYVRSQTGKPGSYSFITMTPEIAEIARDRIGEAYAHAFNTYRSMLSAGVAKEVARMVLPVGTYTEFYWTVNARSLMNFLSLRTSPMAQREIRDYAVAIENHFGLTMPVTYQAWITNDRAAP